MRSDKACSICSREFVPSGNYQVYCHACRGDGRARRKRAYYLSNKEKVDEYCRNWKADNRQRLSARRSELYYASLEQSRSKGREKWAVWHGANPRKNAERVKRYYQKNREKVLSYNRKRIARMRAAYAAMRELGLI